MYLLQGRELGASLSGYATGLLMAGVLPVILMVWVGDVPLSEVPSELTGYIEQLIERFR